MNITNRINRWKDLYNQSADSKTLMYIINYPANIHGFPILNAENKTLRIDWAKKKYEWQVKNVELYEDDSLPHLSPVTGTEIFAEAFGCKVFYPHNNLPGAIPLVSDSKAASKLKVPKLEDTPLMMLFDIMDELIRFAGDDALRRLPDIQCPIDISALIWDKTDFYMTMADEPEAIHELAGKVRELQINFLDEWFKRYGTTYIAHYPDYYMEGGITMSVDELGCISPTMFREFFTGEINELSRRYGGVGIHSCAESESQWDNLKQIEGLKLLNLHRTKSQVLKAIDFYKEKCVQMHIVIESKTVVHNITTEDIEKRFPQSYRVILPLDAQDLDHAKKLAELYSKYR